MGLAIITHPIQLIVLGILLLATALAAAFAEGVRAATAVFRLLRGVRAGAAGRRGVADAVPELARRDQPMGVWWDSTYEMGKGLLDAERAARARSATCSRSACSRIVVMLRTRQFALLVDGAHAR